MKDASNHALRRTRRERVIFYLYLLRAGSLELSRKTSLILAVFLVLEQPVFSGDTNKFEHAEAAARDQLFQRYLAELSEFAEQMRAEGVTNLDQDFTNSARLMFDGRVNHSSFGWKWDEIPAPTLRGSNALAAIEAFVATNGWNMHTNQPLLMFETRAKKKNITGLPWEVIKTKSDMPMHCSEPGESVVVPIHASRRPSR